MAALGTRSVDQTIDGRTELGRALQAWRHDLVDDLGGPEQITTAQRAIVELAVRTKLMVDSVDAFILTMESPVNRRRRMLFPVVVQRQSLANALAHYLGLLGLERRTPPVKSLGQHVAERYGSEPGA
jgi:hypothetical protein